MTDHIQPVLTIGIIFKNEIRCLERCLKSLLPLREKIPCELIMADTGSDDGSREIAAGYADILFDFPWTDDFAAARNAVMDKASGKWYLTMDADECLDTDISELVEFFHSEAGQKSDACTLVQRNYESVDMDGDYSDFMAMRMIRMSLGLRYEGAIHESWAFPEGCRYHAHFLGRTVLHHDGYAELNKEHGKAKRERNLALIRKHLKQEPEDLAGLLQYIESGANEKDFLDVLRKAAALVEEKRDAWERLGSPIFRHAVREARERRLPELKEWIKRAWEWFPDSLFTRLDVEYITFAHEWDEKNYTACISCGKRYLKALADYRKGGQERNELMYGSLLCCSPYCEQTVLLYSADACVKGSDYKKAVQMLNQLDCTFLNTEQTENFIRVLCKIHTESTVDTGPILLRFFDGIQKPVPNKEQADKRRDAFYRTSIDIFSFQSEGNGQTGESIQRPFHTLFLPFGESNELGRAAMTLESEDLLVMQKLLTGVENWDRFPIEALAHAVQRGTGFPLSGRPLKLEEADSLAARLAKDRESFFNILFQTAEENVDGNIQKLIWIRGLALIAVRIFNWNPKDPDAAGTLSAADTKEGIALARLFAKVEAAYLPRYYSQDMLQEENMLSLPLLHRFGWYCVQAFQFLEQGNPAEYVHKLRDGLKVCPEMSAMVEYLIKYTPQLQQKQEGASPELQLLAKQVRTLLSAYPASDPAVAAIKASPAYQKVKHLIEDSELSKNF